MFAEKLIDAYNSEKFNHLLNEQILDEVKHVLSTTGSPTATLIEKNFTTDTHKVVLGTFLDNGHFDPRLLHVDLFKNKCQTDWKIHENGVLVEKSYSFANTPLENSYDETSETRDAIKSVFDQWNPYYKRFLDSVLKCFDGESDNHLNGISFSCDGWGENYNPNLDGKFNRLICHEWPDAQFERDKKIIENLCNLYKITETDQDKDDLDSIIKKIEPILSKENLKINYKLIQSKSECKEFELVIYPFVHESREDVFTSTLKCLHENFDLSLDVIKELTSWEEEDRRFGYISLKLIKKDKIQLEIMCSYGTI